MKVELIYEKTCPNVDAARDQLHRAFEAVGRRAEWNEWEVSEPGCPDYARIYGSPTILIDEVDVSGARLNDSKNNCRIYSTAGGGLSVVPPLERTISALRKEPDMNPVNRKSWTFNTATLPAIGVALLPKLSCPACWPAYAGLLSSLGIGFVDYTPYLMPFTLLFLAISLATMAYKAPNRRGYQPLLLGIAASAVLLIGKFQYDSDAAMYVGLAILVGASLWNTWPRNRTESTATCPACESQ